MNLTEIVRNRHRCKAFDATRKISAADWAQLKSALVHTPSATNAQPWRFIVAQTDAGRARITQSMTDPHFVANAAKVKNASHAVVLCARKSLDAAHLKAVLDAEDKAGRFASPDIKAMQEKGRDYYVNFHRERGNESEWFARQVYIALGFLLMGAAMLGIDACTLEGFDAEALDRELGLHELGQTAVIVVALGYRSADDFNAALPKSRLPEDVVLTEIG
ncbi:MAG: oxygen-insensitive NAD(P)H nitroreductase [Zoogloeaceae bacterium]|jgi:nitroreductase/dihydropteridine reductase|nr:oxygen-insensitive NAD(P)H nitroreductase [Zoogloeaceae bacterium]